MQNSGRLLRHKHRDIRALLSAFLSLLFILTLFSCGTPQNDDSAESESTTTTESASVDDSTLLYYTTLVSRLEEEILQLKEEIFLLQHQESIPVDQPSDTENTLTSTPTEESDYVYEIIDGGAVIVTYCGSGGDVVLPSSLGGCPVVKIGDSAFAKTSVTSVVLPDTVTSIDWFAFRDCLSLTAIVGGKGLSSIGYGAFDGCPASLVVICPKGSYLEAYAASFGIAVRNQ